MKKYNANGFTLMEVMITVVIIGILAAIGYPSYIKLRDRVAAVGCNHQSDAHCCTTREKLYRVRADTQIRLDNADTGIVWAGSWTAGLVAGGCNTRWKLRTHCLL